MILENDHKSLRDEMKIHKRQMNWLIQYSKIDLDDSISPLSAAAYLGRTQIA